MHECLLLGAPAQRPGSYGAVDADDVCEAQNHGVIDNTVKVFGAARSSVGLGSRHQVRLLFWSVLSATFSELGRREPKTIASADKIALSSPKLNTKLRNTLRLPRSIRNG